MRAGPAALVAALRLVALAAAVYVQDDRAHGDDDRTVDRHRLKLKVLEMFNHAYGSYMRYAYPADELMPLSCDGRTRGVTNSRGDVDDAMGNFSLTLIDSADTLAVLGMYDEFDRACQLIVDNVRFDSDLVVSVFETNIRVLGGLLSAHVLALRVKDAKENRFNWYSDQLLRMAEDIGTRLLPAFNSTSGLPFARINLKQGMTPSLLQQQDTCTACGGTAILEFAALSRLTGKAEYERAARKAMDFLWASRHRYSDLMGTVLNIHNGDWVRKDAGVGAGIDSYYEYCLKAYVLLGDVAYLHRFNKHYAAVMKYINRGPALIDVHMHRPTVASRPFMDALTAFWPGLQVLKGDLKPAIETHEMLYQIIQKHQFLPEAFTHDFQVHWAEHWLRPEFIESTYFLYKATRDTHYLRVAEKVIDAMETHVRVRCGYAGIKDLRSMQHEDRMDSFLLAETFKYLYMLFADRDDLLFDVDDFVFTTEAHMLPLALSHEPVLPVVPMSLYDRDFYNDELAAYTSADDAKVSRELQSLADRHSCPNPVLRFNTELVAWGRRLRKRLNNLVHSVSTGGDGDNKQCPSQTAQGQGPPSGPQPVPVDASPLPVSPEDFRPDSAQQLAALQRLGVIVTPGADGSGAVHVAHSPVMAESATAAALGLRFIQQLIVTQGQRQPAQTQENYTRRVVQLLSYPHLGVPALSAWPALFGPLLGDSDEGDELIVHLTVARPVRFCHNYALDMRPLRPGTAMIVQRGDCMFEQKTRNAQAVGAAAVIVVDNDSTSDADVSPPFAMSSADGQGGDSATGANSRPAHITSVFLHGKQGTMVMAANARRAGLLVRFAAKALNPALLLADWLRQSGPFSLSRRNKRLVCDAGGAPALAEAARRETTTITMSMDSETGITCSTETDADEAVLSRHCFDERGDEVEDARPATSEHVAWHPATDGATSAADKERVAGEDDESR